MKKSTAIAAILALFILAILATSAAGYMRLVRHLDEAQAQTQAADARAAELEQQAADLNAEVAEAKRIADERGREVSALRNQAAELEKKVAELKNNSNVITTWADGVQAQPLILNLRNENNALIQAQDAQVQEALRRVQIDLNGVIGNAPANVRLTEPAVKGVDANVRAAPPGANFGGVITINGETMRFGAPVEAKPVEPAPKDIKAVVEETPPAPQVRVPKKRRNAVPPPLEPPKTEEKNAEQF